MNLASGASEPEPHPEKSPIITLSGTVKPTPAHSWFTLVGVSFLIFECFFLTLYGSDFWFSTDISPFGVPVVVIALTVGHFLLSWAESPSGVRFFEPIWKGRPPIIYRRWLAIDESGFSFGIRHVIWQAVDALHLTFFGNTQVFSRALCGAPPAKPDMVLKFPLGSVPAATQAAFIERCRQMNPALTTNKRLAKRLSARDVRGTNIVQSFGAIFMLVILLDVGQSTFSYLQMMKEYYLADTQAREGSMTEAGEHFQAAEKIREHPLPISWVTNKLFHQGVVAAGMEQSRSEALWHLGRKEESVEAARKALELNPTSFRYNLRLARLLTDVGKLPEARAQIRLGIDNHEDSLLPRLYMVALLKGENEREQALKFYSLYLDDLVDLVFGPEPWWPPGGNRYLHEILYQDDVRYIFDRLVGRLPEKPEASLKEAEITAKKARGN